MRNGEIREIREIDVELGNHVAQHQRLITLNLVQSSRYIWLLNHALTPYNIHAIVEYNKIRVHNPTKILNSLSKYSTISSSKFHPPLRPALFHRRHELWGMS